MNQFLAIIRGAPASGKTTIAKMMRDFDQRIVWLKVDNFKDFFSEDPAGATMYIDGSAIATLEYLLNQGFSVVMEKIFLDPTAITTAVEMARSKNIPVKVFQIRCSLRILQERDKTRPGIREGCRKPLGDEAIARMHQKLEETFYEGAVVLDTEIMPAEECIRVILESFK